MQEQIDKCIQELAKSFLDRPNDFFQERESHSVFFGICRGRFGAAKTQGITPVEVSLFRQEFNTIWKYNRKKSFAERYESTGKAGSLDFAILRENFVANSDLLAVINKDETLRRQVRAYAVQQVHSPVIAAGVEFKMAHLRSAFNVSRSDIDNLEAEMVLDARKLAHERIEHSFLVGLCHGDAMKNDRALEIARVCANTFSKIHPQGHLHVYLIAPSLPPPGLLVYDAQRPPAPPNLPQQPQQRPITVVEPPNPPIAPLPIGNAMPEIDHVYYRNQSKDELYVCCGTRQNNSRLVPHNSQGNYFPQSVLIPNNQLTLAPNVHSVADDRPQNGEVYCYDPPQGETKAPCDVPCNVTVRVRGGGSTSTVSVKGYPDFNVPTHHLRRTPCSNKPT